MKGLSLIILVLSLCQINYAQYILTDKLVGTNNEGIINQGVSVKISDFGNIAVVGGLGAVWIYSYDGSNFIPLGDKIKAPLSDSVKFGYDVDISEDGKVLVIGGLRESADFEYVGGFYVYTFNGLAYVQNGERVECSGSTGRIHSLDISSKGNVIVAANRRDAKLWVYSNTGVSFTQIFTHQGEVSAANVSGNGGVLGVVKTSGSEPVQFQIFTINGTTYQSTGKIYTPSDASPTFFETIPSIDVSRDGSRIIIGNNIEDSGEGAAWVYSLVGNDYKQIGGKISPDHLPDLTYFGSSLAMASTGNTFVVGSSTENAIYVYTTNGLNYSQIDKIVITTSGTNIDFSSSLGISGDGSKIISGAQNYDGWKGAAWIFSNSTSNCVSPTIISPAGVTTLSSCACSNIHLSVSVISPPPLIYNWYFINQIFSTASTPGISINIPTVSGTYRCTIFNNCGSVTSPPFNITSIPVNISKPVIARDGNNLMVSNAEKNVNYQWIYNGSEETSETTMKHNNPLQTGTYQVKASSQCAVEVLSDTRKIINMVKVVTLTTEEIIIKNHCPNEIESKAIKNLDIYPNPSSGIITIQVNGFISGKIEIFNAHGVKLMQTEFRQTLDLSHFPKGLYFLSLQDTTTGGFATKKIIIE